ncbi:hypothetical protein [Paraburkholderia sp. J94]|uniref:hypothetical protein n=1 Tax=Paraburkholderia sp. J94 TaxID=2805441 RepID=UPI002AB09B6F|nr:hypothetical protein [Paraburkholderia sp. J94]
MRRFSIWARTAKCIAECIVSRAARGRAISVTLAGMSRQPNTFAQPIVVIAALSRAMSARAQAASVSVKAKKQPLI